MAPALGWQSVRDEALRRIRSRDWPPGARIPDEAALAAELGCARATVNRALRDLAGAGLLDRRRKGGTRVPLTPVRKATFEIAIIRADIATRGQEPGYALLSDALELTPDDVQRALGAGTPEVMRHIRALHRADGVPFCLEDRWLNPATAPQDIRFATISANEWLVQSVTFSAGGLTFGALAAEAETAGLLGCAPGTALLVLDRTTRAEAPITWVRLTYAPGHTMHTAL